MSEATLPPAAATRRRRPADAVAVALLLLVIWQVVGAWTGGIALSTPLVTAAYLVNLLRTSLFWEHAGATAWAFLLAYLLSAAGGLALGLILGLRRFAGEVAEPILGRVAKADALVEICARLGLTPAYAIAVGDGANDLDMIKLAGTGVALHAKPAVAAEAKARIDHADLSALLYLQGYRRDEFAE